MNLGAQSGLLAAIVSLAVAVSVLLRGRRTLVNTLFIVFSSNLMVYFTATFLDRSIPSELAEWSLWYRLALIAAAFLPITSLLFFSHFLWEKPQFTRPHMRGIYFLSFLLVGYLCTPLSDNRVTVAVMLTYVFSTLYSCAYLILIRQREIKSQRERIRLRYLLGVHLAATTFILLGMLTHPLGFLSTWGDLVSIFFLYFLSQSLLHFRLLDVQELLGRGVVLIAVAFILAIVFGVFVFWVGGSPEVPLFHTFVASFVILILFEPLRDKLESSTHKLFFREHYELRRNLEELRREIANIIDLQEMSEGILDALYDSMHISSANIYFQEESGNSYNLIGHRGPAPTSRFDAASHRSFFEQLKKTPTALLAETFERQLVGQGAPADSKPSSETIHASQVLETLLLLKSSICIPFVSQNDILGFLNLLDETGTESYSTEEIARMMAIGEQAAINIENSKMFDRIRERDRLAVLGEMAAGLAHEIRNPLGAIKGAAQYLDPSMAGEDASEFLKIIIEETDRLNQVVDQFLDYARPYQMAMNPTDINQIILQTIRLLTPQKEERQIELSIELQENLPPIKGNSQQLTQVLLNLLNNAIEAMPEGGLIKVQSMLRTHTQSSKSRNPKWTETLEVLISDNGPGITQESLKHIFVPFYTTKEKGTGLGLAISQRIVRHHGGEIRVRTKSGHGTTFAVILPCLLETSAQLEKSNPQKSSQKNSDKDDLPLTNKHSNQTP